MVGEPEETLRKDVDLGNHRRGMENAYAKPLLKGATAINLLPMLRRSLVEFRSKPF
jgi:hypothetical protein